jgi:hypothetical protein
MSKVKSKLNECWGKLRSGALLLRTTIAPFVPGALLFACGLAAVLAPAHLIYILATFFCCIGIFVCYLGWRFLQAARKVQKMVSEFEARFYVQGMNVRTGSGQGVETLITVADSNKKTFYH